MAAVILVSRDVAWALQLVRQWRSEQRGLHLVLLDGAAAAARTTHPLAGDVGAAAHAGTVVWVHDDALGRRGMTPSGVIDGIKTVTLDEVADLVGDADGQVMWL